LNPYVSVMMPAKNAELYIAQAIESIISQTYSNWELIIVDDKSIDNTKQIILKYQKIDKRILVLEGKGICSGNARNEAISIAKGKYVMNMDADDVSNPRRIEALLEVAEQLRNPVVGSNVAYTDSNLKIIKYSNFPLVNAGIRAGFKRRFNRMTIMPGVILTSAEILRKFKYREFYKILVDWDLMLRLGEDASIEFANLREALYYYRRNSGSMTKNQKTRIAFNLLLRFNELQRKRNGNEIKSLEEFRTFVKSNPIRYFLYNTLFSLKIVQHKMLMKRH
jgi:glycosyltransferase involved in cell wall biosynthesis